MVDQYPFSLSAIWTFQRTLPSLASREMRWASGVVKYSQSLYMATPRCPMCRPLVGRIGVMPDLMAGARIHRPDVVRHGEVQDAVDQQGRGLQGRRLARLKRPGQRERPNVLRSDLGQRTMAPAGIIPVIARPTVGGRICNRRRIETLRQQAAGNRKRQREHEKNEESLIESDLWFAIRFAPSAGFAGKPSGCERRRRCTLAVTRRELRRGRGSCT